MQNKIIQKSIFFFLAFAIFLGLQFSLAFMKVYDKQWQEYLVFIGLLVFYLLILYLGKVHGLVTSFKLLFTKKALKVILKNWGLLLLDFLRN